MSRALISFEVIARSTAVCREWKHIISFEVTVRIVRSTAVCREGKARLAIVWIRREFISVYSKFC